MKEYNFETSKIEYHPDDTPDYYLNMALLNDLLKIIKKNAATEKDFDTVDFIRKHEESQILLAKGKLSQKVAAIQ